MGNTLATSALSVTDFNTLRLNIAKAILVLDTKIDEILSVPTLSCSTVASLSRGGGELHKID